MAKLNKTQKTGFHNFKEMIGALGDYAFFFSRENGVSAMAFFTGPKKKHVRIVVVHCGENDTFKKKIGFVECACRMEKGAGIVLPAVFNILDDCLEDFLLSIFDCGYKWETI